MQERAMRDKQGVTGISQREELSLLWLLRRYLWRINNRWTGTSRYNKHKPTWLTSFRLLCKHRIISNASQTRNSDQCNNCKAIMDERSHEIAYPPAKLQFNSLIYICSLSLSDFYHLQTFWRVTFTTSKTISTSTMSASLYYLQRKGEVLWGALDHKKISIHIQHWCFPVTY